MLLLQCSVHLLTLAVVVVAAVLLLQLAVSVHAVAVTEQIFMARCDQSSGRLRWPLHQEMNTCAAGAAGDRHIVLEQQQRQQQQLQLVSIHT
jgi:hypothetical protein